jgi:hypothetical protein
MKYNKIVTAFCAAALGLMSLTSCEGGDLFSINAPDWLSSKADSIAAEKAKNQGGDVIEGLEEDVYTIGKEDMSSGFWTLGKTYVVPAGQKWQAQFNLTVNPDDVYYKNCYIVFNDYNPDTDDHLGAEYGVIRFDNDPTKNSEWGGNIDRSLVKANFENSSGDDDIDASVQKMNGKVTITVDRTEGGVHYTITNGELKKEYIQSYDFPMNNSEGKICCRIGIEKSIVNFLGSTIEPIGGFTSREDKQPLSMTLNGVPKKVLQGVTLEEAFANVTATVQFEEGVSSTVSAANLTFQTIPDMSSLGKKTLVAAYAKTFKGEAAAKPVIASADFSIVDKLFTCIGATDNTSGFREEKTENFKVGPGETYINHFTNYTDGAANWNNFIITLCKADNTEYCFVRADNWGTGTSYWEGCQSCDWNWDTFKAVLDGAKVTTYITNNGDGTADVKAVVEGSDGNTYTQNYKGLNNIDPNDFCFNLSTEKGHLEFDYVIGNEENTSGFRAETEAIVKVPAGATYVERFINHTDGSANWNNFIITLCKADNTEYCFVRADNWGTGTSYWDGCQSCDWNWDSFREIIDGAVVTTYITNNGDGTASVKAVVEGSDGNTYIQNYKNLKNIDSNDFYYSLSMEKAHLVFE